MGIWSDESIPGEGFSQQLFVLITTKFKTRFQIGETIVLANDRRVIVPCGRRRHVILRCASVLCSLKR